MDARTARLRDWLHAHTHPLVREVGTVTLVTALLLTAIGALGSGEGLQGLEGLDGIAVRLWGPASG